MNEDIIFDYATRYCWDHPALASVDSFQLTDEDYKEFKKLVKSRDFKYDRQSEKMLKSLKEVAEFEGYMEGCRKIKALEKKLNHNLDPRLGLFLPSKSKDICAGNRDPLFLSAWGGNGAIERG